MAERRPPLPWSRWMRAHAKAYPRPHEPSLPSRWRRAIGTMRWGTVVLAIMGLGLLMGPREPSTATTVAGLACWIGVLPALLAMHALKGQRHREMQATRQQGGWAPLAPRHEAHLGQLLLASGCAPLIAWWQTLPQPRLEADAWCAQAWLHRLEHARGAVAGSDLASAQALLHTSHWAARGRAHRQAQALDQMLSHEPTPPPASPRARL